MDTIVTFLAGSHLPNYEIFKINFILRLIRVQTEPCQCLCCEWPWTMAPSPQNDRTPWCCGALLRCDLILMSVGVVFEKSLFQSLFFVNIVLWSFINLSTQLSFPRLHGAEMRPHSMNKMHGMKCCWNVHLPVHWPRCWYKHNGRSKRNCQGKFLRGGAIRHALVFQAKCNVRSFEEQFRNEKHTRNKLFSSLS